MVRARGGGGAARRSSAPRRRAAGEGERGLPDSVWAPVWPWGMREACVIHWSGKQGAAGDGAGSTAWSGGARSPACGAWAPLWVTGYDNSCKRKRGPGCSSPSTGLDGGVTQRRRRRAPAAGRGRSFAVRALQGSSERLDPSGWLAVLLRRGYGG